MRMHKAMYRRPTAAPARIAAAATSSKQQQHPQTAAAATHRSSSSSNTQQTAAADLRAMEYQDPADVGQDEGLLFVAASSAVL